MSQATVWCNGRWGGLSYLLLAALLPLLSIPGRAQTMRGQAQQAIQLPVRTEVNPVKQGIRAGEVAEFEVSLRDGRGELTKARQTTALEVQLTQPSGATTTVPVQLAPGESSKRIAIPTTEAGASKVTIREVNNNLLGGSNYVYASPKATKKKPAQKRPATPPTDKKTGLFRPLPHGTPRLVFAAWTYQDHQPQPAGTQAAAPQPKLMLKVSGENDVEGVHADGISFARIQVFYMGGEPPAAPIQVWVQWSNGQIDVNPVIIRPGEVAGEAHWTSRATIASAKLRVAGTNPPGMAFEGPTEATVNFTPPILGVGFVDPPEKMSIVDTFDLSAAFFNHEGVPTQTWAKRSYQFATNNPSLRLNPRQGEVEAGKFEFSTVLVPTALGSAKIQAMTPGYPPATVEIRITGLLVLVICVIGGVLGGVVGFINSGGSLWKRVLAGVIVGLVASWAYVYIGLPNTASLIAHNQVSMFFVAILAAFSGVKALDKISKALNIAF